MRIKKIECFALILILLWALLGLTYGVLGALLFFVFRIYSKLQGEGNADRASIAPQATMDTHERASAIVEAADRISA